MMVLRARDGPSIPIISSAIESMLSKMTQCPLRLNTIHSAALIQPCGMTNHRDQTRKTPVLVQVWIPRAALAHLSGSLVESTLVQSRLRPNQSDGFVKPSRSCTSYCCGVGCWSSPSKSTYFRDQYDPSNATVLELRQFEYLYRILGGLRILLKSD